MKIRTTQELVDALSAALEHANLAATELMNAQASAAQAAAEHADAENALDLTVATAMSAGLIEGSNEDKRRANSKAQYRVEYEHVAELYAKKLVLGAAADVARTRYSYCREELETLRAVLVTLTGLAGAHAKEA